MTEEKEFDLRDGFSLDPTLVGPYYFEGLGGFFQVVYCPNRMVRKHFGKEWADKWVPVGANGEDGPVEEETAFLSYDAKLLNGIANSLDYRRRRQWSKLRKFLMKSGKLVNGWWDCEIKIKFLWTVLRKFSEFAMVYLKKMLEKALGEDLGDILVANIEDRLRPVVEKLLGKKKMVVWERLKMNIKDVVIGVMSVATNIEDIKVCIRILCCCESQPDWTEEDWEEWAM